MCEIVLLLSKLIYVTVTLQNKNELRQNNYFYIKIDEFKCFIIQNNEHLNVLCVLMRGFEIILMVKLNRIHKVIE